MGTHLLMFVMCLLFPQVNAQELNYFHMASKTSEIRQSFFPKDMISPLEVNTVGWKNSGVIEVDNKGLKLLEWPRLQNFFKDLSDEDKEIIKGTSYLLYIDKHFKLVTFIANINAEDIGSFHRVEKKIYEFARLHDDVSDYIPYFEFEGEFTGIALRLPLSWLDKGPK